MITLPEIPPTTRWIECGYMARLWTRLVLYTLILTRGVLPDTTLSTSVQEMQTMEMKSVSKVTQIIEAVKTSVKNRTARWLEYDEGVRYHRCQLASNQALRELEQIKNGVRGESYKSSFYR